MFKRLFLCLICLCLLLPSCFAEAVPESMGLDWQENDPWPHAIRNGSRDERRVAVTMDDCYEFEYVRKTWELITSYGGRMTFYPVGELLKDEKTTEADRELWRAIAASSSEIGTHTHHHNRMTKETQFNQILYSKYPQHVIDHLLGYHYPIRTLRPPFGSHDAVFQKQLEKVGYHHVILWDVDSTDADEVKKNVQNGSIILFHARKKDYLCLEKVIPWLAEQGYEMVTISELLNLPPLEPVDELFDWSVRKTEFLGK